MRKSQLYRNLLTPKLFEKFCKSASPIQLMKPDVRMARAVPRIRRVKNKSPGKQRFSDRFLAKIS